METLNEFPGKTHSHDVMNELRHFSKPLPRRSFLKGIAASSGLLAAGGPALFAADSPEKVTAAKSAYRGPNVIVMRCLNDSITADFSWAGSRPCISPIFKSGKVRLNIS